MRCTPVGRKAGQPVPPRDYPYEKILRTVSNPPKWMKNPHAHHILFKKGLGPAQQELANEGAAILRRAGIDPIFGTENLYWAPNIAGQHTIEALTHVVETLREVEKRGGDYDDFVEALRTLGEEAARRK